MRELSSTVFADASFLPSPSSPFLLTPRHLTSETEVGAINATHRPSFGCMKSYMIEQPEQDEVYEFNIMRVVSRSAYKYTDYGSNSECRVLFLKRHNNPVRQLPSVEVGWLITTFTFRTHEYYHINLSFSPFRPPSSIIGKLDAHS